MSAQTITQVITELNAIIVSSQNNNDPLGYFAALYQKVTTKVKEGIDEGTFEDGPRMEQLDVIFANRYLDAYKAFQDQTTVTECWQEAFEMSTQYWPIVLQHLLIGMNAHINLDLSIAAAQVMEGKDIHTLKNDFDKINEILSALVAEVEEDLSAIWPTLKKLLMWSQKVDDFLIDFSMELARNGAWEFAVALSKLEGEALNKAIQARDFKVAKKGRIIKPSGFIATIILRIIRIGEQGTVGEKIGKMLG